MEPNQKFFVRPEKPAPEANTKERAIYYLKWAGALIAAAASIGAIIHGLTGYIEAYRAAQHVFPSKQPTQIEPPRGARRTTPKPNLSIAVLPFDTVGADQDWLAEGLTSDLTIDLSRITGSTVISQGAAYHYKGKLIDERKIGDELNARYLVIGSVQHLSGRIRVNVRLVETDSSSVVWAHRVEGSLEDALDVQTQITAQVARAMNFALIQGAAKRIDSSSKTDAAASEDAARGWAILIYRPGLEQLTKAQELFESAFSKDPGLASSRVGLATVLAIIPFERTLTEAERAKSLERAEELLRPVLNGPSATADAYFALGRIRRSQFRNDDAIVAFERAVALNPNHPGALRHLGVAQMAVGQPQKAIEAVKRLIEISPRDPLLFEMWRTLGIAQVLTGQNEEAVISLRKSRDLRPDQYRMWIFLAAASSLTGDMDGAGQALLGLKKTRPEINSIEAWLKAEAILRDPRYRALAEQTVFVGLEKAGFPAKSP